MGKYHRVKREKENQNIQGIKKNHIGTFYPVKMQSKMNKYQAAKVRQCIRDCTITRSQLEENAVHKDNV